LFITFQKFNFLKNNKGFFRQYDDWQLCFVQDLEVLNFQSSHKPNLLIQFCFARINFANFHTTANLNLAFFRWCDVVSLTHSPCMKYRYCYRFVVYPPFIRQTNKISAIYPPTLSLYLVPFFSPTFSNIFCSVKNSKSREAVLSEVSPLGCRANLSRGEKK